MSSKQELYAQSLAQQLLTCWAKLGNSNHQPYKKYKFWTEESIHVMLYNDGLTEVQRSSFGGAESAVPCDYTGKELTVCIARMQKLLQGYKDMWTKYWTADRDKRIAVQDDDERIKKKCLSYHAAMEYLSNNSLSYKLPEVFAFEKSIGNTSYFRKREKIIRMYSRREAETMLKQFFGTDRAFGEAFTEHDIPGWTGLLYTANFELRAAI